MKYAQKYESSIYAVTVGSEALYRYSQEPTTGLTADALLAQIKSFSDTQKQAGLDFPIGTADSWNMYLGTADDIITSGLVKILYDCLWWSWCTMIADIARFVNAFGYWQQSPISNATKTYLDDLQQAYGAIQEKAGSTTSIELWNGETGWPSTGMISPQPSVNASKLYTRWIRLWSCPSWHRQRTDLLEAKRLCCS